MQEFSSWQNLLDSCTLTASKNGKLQLFSEIKNDNIKRVKFLLQESETRDSLMEWMNQCIKDEDKSVEQSVTLRERGNQYYAIKDYQTCIETYTQSIKLCPVSNKEELSLAYANRAAALYELELYEDCLSDIELALVHEYPAKLLPKILLRKLKCLHKLQKESLFDATIEKLDIVLQNMSLADKGKIKDQIKGLKEDTCIQSSASNDSSQEPTELFGGSNLEVSYASAALDVKSSKEKGRYVVANQSIQHGNTLFVERPYAIVVLPEFHDQRCHHCSQVLKKQIPCLHCGSTWFCSTICRVEAWKLYHQYECGLLPLLYSIGIAHLGLRVVLISGLEQLLKFQEEMKVNAGIPGIDEKYDTHSYRTIFHLVSHVEDMASEELYQYTLTAALLSLVLEHRTRFMNNLSTNDDMLPFIVGSFLLHHICQLVCNAHAITEICMAENNKDSVVEEKQQRIATAIYPSASLMNHSCHPTVINSFHGNTLIVRTIKDVTKGEEIFNCYGPHYRRMRRSERLESLSTQYHFHCTCGPCTDASAEDFQEALYSFLCPFCQGPLINPNEGNSLKGSQRTLCRSCRQFQDYMPQLKADMEALTLDAEGSEAMNVGDMALAVERLSRCVALRKKALYKGHPDLGQSADKLAQCYAFLGRYEDCIRYLQIALTAVEEQYGRYSIEMANEIQKYTDVLMELLSERRDEDMICQLRSYLEEAELIYNIHYGIWSRAYQEIHRKIDQLKCSTLRF